MNHAGLPLMAVGFWSVSAAFAVVLLRLAAVARLGASALAGTGWQPQVRGFFAGVVRKKLALRLESEKTDGERVYGIVAAKPSVDTTGQPSA